MQNWDIIELPTILLNYTLCFLAKLISFWYVVVCFDAFDYWMRYNCSFMRRLEDVEERFRWLSIALFFLKRISYPRVRKTMNNPISYLGIIDFWYILVFLDAFKKWIRWNCSFARCSRCRRNILVDFPPFCLTC